jgi:hypothetical protein
MLANEATAESQQLLRNSAVTDEPDSCLQFENWKTL